MLVLVPGKVVGSLNVTPVPGLWKILNFDEVPGVWDGFSLTILEGGLWSSASSSTLWLLWVSGWSWNGWLLIFLLKSKLVSLVLSPSVLNGGPSAVRLNSDIVNTSNDSHETVLTEVGTPGVSDSPVLDAILDTKSNNGDVVNDVLVTSLVLVDTTLVVLKVSWNCDTASNWTSLVDLLHHGLLARDLTVLIGVVDFVVVLVPAALRWGAVFAHDLLRALGTVVMTSGSVDGACFISDLVVVHPLKGVVCLTTMAAIITRAGNEDLWSNVDIWPGSLSRNLDSIRHSRCSGMSPA